MKPKMLLSVDCVSGIRLLSSMIAFKAVPNDCRVEWGAPKCDPYPTRGPATSDHEDRITHQTLNSVRMGSASLSEPTPQILKITNADLCMTAYPWSVYFEGCNSLQKRVSLYHLLQV